MPKNHKWFSVTNEATTKSSVVMIYDKIGKSWTGDDGVAAKDFSDELRTVPTDHEINVHINSRGGNVWDGMAIHGMLQGRKDKVTCHVDGVAASIASVIACAGKKTIIGKGALMMKHPPSALPMDALNASEARALADKLDVHAKAIASVYAAKSGKTEDEELKAMNKGETWLTADDAVSAGYCDEISGDATAFLNEAKDFDFSNFGNAPEILRGDKKTTPPNNIMNKTQIIAFLSTNGITVAADASDEVINGHLTAITAKLKAAPIVPAIVAPAAGTAAEVTALTAQIANITAHLAAEKKTRIEKEVNDLVSNCQVTAEEAPKAVIRAVADETYLAELQARPQVLPGVQGLTGSPAVYTKDDSVRNALKELQTKGVSEGKGGMHAFDTSVDRSQAVRQIYAESRDKIVTVMNAAANNQIAAGLKRVLILQETVRDFATRVLPVRMFSSVFENLPLEGTDSFEIAYYPLQAAASQNFTDGDGTGGTGYQFGQGTNTNSVIVPCTSRKYQPLDYSSNNFRRQPWFDAVRLGKINAEKLGVDILLDILSVFTPANFPTIPQADPTFNPNLALQGAAYDSNQIADLKTVATNLNWPDGGRSLIAGTTLDNALGKDPAYKLALNIGTTDVIQQGKFPRISGFDYATMPGFPNNGCNLQGLIAFASAVAAGFAPIDPAAGVRQQLVSYDIATDIATGISMNHRHWGVAQADRDFEVIESAYGYQPLIAHAAQLLTHP